MECLAPVDQRLDARLDRLAQKVRQRQAVSGAVTDPKVRPAKALLVDPVEIGLAWVAPGVVAVEILIR